MDRERVRQLLSPDYAIQQIVKVHRGIAGHIRELPEASFKPYWLDTPHGKKQLAAVDLMAEQTFISAVTAKFGSHSVNVVGEESLRASVDLRQETRTSVLVDMIDGTDLLQRNFSNWCSAIVVFDPKKKQILGTFVAIPPAYPLRTGWLYFATKDHRPQKKPLSISTAKRDPAIALLGPAVDRQLNDATVCSYGQKNANCLALLALAEKVILTDWLKSHVDQNETRRSQSQEELKFRFYNFAGNPMMVRLADGVVDAVFDLKGQALHDVVPGAFIALQAGAVMRDPVTGKPITVEDLGRKLEQPSTERLRYVLAANDRLAEELISLVR
jgi:fructose-1,6-bisphosphatase/inositol monophosphatase family enzyme